MIDSISKNQSDLNKIFSLQKKQYTFLPSLFNLKHNAITLQTLQVTQLLPKNTLAQLCFTKSKDITEVHVYNEWIS